MKELNAGGMIVQGGLECPFAPALTAPPDVRAAGTTDNSAAESLEVARCRGLAYRSTTRAECDRALIIVPLK